MGKQPMSVNDRRCFAAEQANLHDLRAMATDIAERIKREPVSGVESAVVLRLLNDVYWRGYYDGQARAGSVANGLRAALDVLNA